MNVTRFNPLARRIALAAPLCALLLASGCVSSGKYDDLKRAFDESQGKLKTTEQTLGAANARVSELEAQIAAKQAELRTKQAEAKKLQAEIDRLADEETRLTEELAQLMKDKSRLKESTAQLKQALAELAQRKAEADRRVAQFRSLLDKFKSMIDAGKLQVKIVDGRMVLALPTDVLFGSGSADLSKEGTAAVTEVAQLLTSLGERRFQVEGHTDNVPIKSARFPSNWELSSARALGVVKAMEAAGMGGAQLSAAGFGEFRPVTSNDSREGQAQNRRIEIVVVPDLSNLPGFDELKKVVGK